MCIAVVMDIDVVFSEKETIYPSSRLVRMVTMMEELGGYVIGWRDMLLG